MKVHAKHYASDADRLACSHAERTSLCVYADDKNLIMKNNLVFFKRLSFEVVPVRQMME